jgi:hypothetical protein
LTGGSALSPLGRRWVAIAAALRIRVTAPASIVLPSGKQIDADALIVDFGAQLGMLLVTDDQIVWPHRAAITDAGYGFSVLSEPRRNLDSPLDIDGAKAVLRDWGWAGSNENRPDWV